MRESTSRAFVLLLALTAIAGSARAASSLWLHVTVDEGGGAKVTVNLPLALAEKALPMIPLHDELRWHHHRGHDGMELEDLREIWAEVKNSPDMTFVTAEDDGEKVRVWKEKDFVFVEVRDDDGDEKVDVQVPLEVVDALVSGDEIDFTAAVQALAKRGGGDLVSVRDRDDNVRVWIDETPEAR
ncbi:MAG: hypothetical protein GY769_01140 [bacterium]|nr:hypothetical protein [bacterium]